MGVNISTLHIVHRNFLSYREGATIVVNRQLAIGSFAGSIDSAAHRFGTVLKKNSGSAQHCTGRRGLVLAQNDNSSFRTNNNPCIALFSSHGILCELGVRCPGKNHL